MVNTREPAVPTVKYTPGPTHRQEDLARRRQGAEPPGTGPSPRLSGRRAGSATGPSWVLAIQFADYSPQLDYRKWTVRPIVLPTNDDITTAWVMAMLFEIAAQVLELNPDSLPPLAVAADAPLRLAVRVCRVDRFDAEPDLVTDHTEEENYALLIDRGMP